MNGPLWNHALQFNRVNYEYLESVCHQRTLNTSLPFVHTAHRSYRLDELVGRLEKLLSLRKIGVLLKNLHTRLSRGRRSRNKVSVGEPAEG